MTVEYRSQQGYLVVADISGYTTFLTGTELEHAQAIIHELTTLIRERLAPPLRFVKREGDAVFCYADDAALPDGERLAELLEVCYFDFSNRLLDMTRATTCRCNACASIDALDLKFVAHYGSFIVEQSYGAADLVGADVILVHRLLKNSIVKSHGTRAYVFFTATCLGKMPATIDLPKHVETSESFGETEGGVHDLEPVLREMRESRREYISSAVADFETSYETRLPPPLVWRYFVDPLERLRWSCRLLDKNPDKSEPNALGRLGGGASFHCNHGPGGSMREYVDWRPYSYFTCRTTAPLVGAFLTAGRATETFEFDSTDDGGTVVHYRLRLIDRGAFSKLTFLPARFFIKAATRTWQSNLSNILEEDEAVRESSGELDEFQPPLKNA
jgi:uncharacterized protein YndB with AHSA1/START domain